MAHVDEGPSSEDIARFDHESAFCPDCGAEIWDQADVCPKCFAYLGGDTSRRQPMGTWFQRRWTLLVVIVLLLAMLAWLL
jgi:hypothetical protein